MDNLQTSDEPPYVKEIMRDPTGFFRSTRVWAISQKPSTNPDRMFSYRQDLGENRVYNANSSFISKVVLTTIKGRKAMFMATSYPKNPFGFMEHFADLLVEIDFNKLEFGPTGHFKAEFAAPEDERFAFLITTDGSRPDMDVFPSSQLSRQDERIIINSQGKPDVIINWSFCSQSDGAHLVGLTAGGNLLKMNSHENGTKYYKYMATPGVLVQDVVTIINEDHQLEFIIASNNGLIHRGEKVPGTSTMSVSNMCFDIDTSTLWCLGVDGSIHRLRMVAGKLLSPQLWSKTKSPFKGAASQRLIYGPKSNVPLLTAWFPPQEVEPAQDGRPSQRSIRYDRMEVPSTIPN